MIYAVALAAVVTHGSIQNHTGRRNLFGALLLEHLEAGIRSRVVVIDGEDIRIRSRYTAHAPVDHIHTRIQVTDAVTRIRRVVLSVE